MSTRSFARSSAALAVALACGATVAVAARDGLAASGGRLSVSRLRWDAHDRPLGYIQFEPRLGWVVSSSERGQKQTAYQVLVASEPRKLKPGVADVWDSKKVVSGESINVRYGGPTPQARQRAYWTVRVWDKVGRPSPFAPASWWEVGLLDEEWEGQWIGRPAGAGAAGVAADAGAAGAADRSVTHLRKAFAVDKPIRRARLYASAFGVYELSLNGARVGDQTLAPGYTDYEKRVLFQAYDVTELVRRGANAVGALVAGGWCTAAPQGRAGACGNEPPRVMAQLEILLADGSLQTIITDRSWKAHAGPTLSAHLTEGEHYDARLEMPGWDAPGFDDAGWAPVAQYDKKKERDLVADAGAPIRITQDVRPVRRTEPHPGTTVFDLGQSIVGRARLRGTFPSGAVLVLRHGDALRADGTVGALPGVTDSYIGRGAATETWEPRFAVHGFRFVEVRNLGARARLEAVTGRVVQSVTPATGSLQTSDARLNRLFEDVAAAQRGAFVSVPAGVSTHGEEPGGLRDAQLFAGTACLNADVQLFYRKWIDDIRDAQLPDASYATAAPARDRQPAGAGAAAGGVMVPWALFRCYADRTALDAHLPSMGRWLHHVRDASPGLVWQQAEKAGGVNPLAKEAATDPSLIGTAEVIHAATALAQMMRHAGPTLEGEARGFEQLAADARVAFGRTFARPDGKLTSDTQAAYAIALALGALPAETRARAGAQLVAALERAGHAPATGIASTAHLLPALSAIGRDDVAYRVLSRLIATPGRYASGAVGEWMYDAVGGIALDPQAPAGRHVIVRPRPGGGVTFARARYDSLYGPIATDWRQDERAFRLKVTIPANSTATVTLPAGAATEGGAPLAAAKGVRVRGPAPGGGTVVSIDSGTYDFSVAR